MTQLPLKEAQFEKISISILILMLEMDVFAQQNKARNIHSQSYKRNLDRTSMKNENIFYKLMFYKKYSGLKWSF